jgi:glucose-1-phosphate adenylyltransferase
MDNCDIGRHAKVRRAILDKNVRVPQGTLIGHDLDADRARGWHVTDSGIVVISGEHSTVPVAALFV